MVGKNSLDEFRTYESSLMEHGVSIKIFRGALFARKMGTTQSEELKTITCKGYGSHSGRGFLIFNPLEPVFFLK